MVLYLILYVKTLVMATRRQCPSIIYNQTKGSNLPKSSTLRVFPLHVKLKPRFERLESFVFSLVGDSLHRESINVT